MIDTGREFSKHTNYIMYTDDINSNNVTELSEFYSLSDLIIDKKFELPATKDTNTIISSSDTIKTINKKINEEIINKFNSGDTTIVNTNTQLDNLISKLNYWVSNVFKDIIEKIDNKQSVIRIFINHNPSTHENIMIKLLYELGVTFIIVTDKKSTVNDIDNVKYSWENTCEKLDIEKYKTNNTLNTNIDNIEDVLTALNNKNSSIKVILSGVDIREKAYDVYRGIHELAEKDSTIAWLTQENFINVNEEAMQISSRIPRGKMDNTEYVKVTMKMFITNTASISKEDWDNVMKQYALTLKPMKFVDNLAKAIVAYNNIIKNTVNTLVFYGEFKDYISILVDLLDTTSTKNIIIISSNKEKILKNNSNNFKRIELENSVDYFDIQNISYLGAVKTQAASVEKEVNQQLFSGDTLGMYKHGQFKSCNTTRFSTAYVELPVWWNKEVYLRPGFVSQETNVVIPTIFKVISGIDREPIQFKRFIASLCYGKTMLYNTVEHLNTCKCVPSNDTNFSNIIRATDINKTSFESQKKLFENGNIQRQRVKSGVNYKYSILSEDKQEVILKKIEDIINNKLINYKLFGLSYEQYIDEVLKVGLNLSKSAIQHINWFDYFGDNPNIIVILNNDTVLSISDIIYLVLMSLCGFDVLIFVPTRYASIENKVSESMMVDYHIVGEAYYNMDTDAIDSLRESIVTQQKSSKGIFNKLFRKKGN